MTAIMAGMMATGTVGSAVGMMNVVPVMAEEGDLVLKQDKTSDYNVFKNTGSLSGSWGIVSPDDLAWGKYSRIAICDITLDLLNQVDQNLVSWAEQENITTDSLTRMTNSQRETLFDLYAWTIDSKYQSLISADLKNGPLYITDLLPNHVYFVMAYDQTTEVGGIYTSLENIKIPENFLKFVTDGNVATNVGSMSGNGTQKCNLLTSNNYKQYTVIDITADFESNPKKKSKVELQI